MISINSSSVRRAHVNLNTGESSFLDGIKAWDNKQLRKAEACFKRALDSEALTAEQLKDMGDFFKVAAKRNALAALCYERAIETSQKTTGTVPNTTRVDLSRCFYQQWQKSLFKKPELLQKAGDQMALVLQNTSKPVRNATDYRVFAEQSYPNPRQAADVGLRLSKQCVNASEAKSILAHVAAKISTRHKVQPFGMGTTSYLHAQYKPSFSTLSKQMREEVAGFLCDHRHDAFPRLESEAYAALSVIPKEEIPLTTARLQSERQQIYANQFDQKIIGKYIRG